MTRNAVRWNRPLTNRECEDGDTAGDHFGQGRFFERLSLDAVASSGGLRTGCTTTFVACARLPSHLPASPPKAVGCGRPAGGRNPAMPCQRLYPVQSAADSTQQPSFLTPGRYGIRDGGL